MSGYALPRTRLHRRATAVPATGWLAFLAETLRAAATRRHLAEMDDRMLKDIGITRTEALQEANRAPWDFSRRV